MTTGSSTDSQPLKPATWDDFLGIMKQVEREVTLLHKHILGSDRVTFRTAVKELIQEDRSLAWLDSLHPYIDIRNAYAHNPSLHPPALIPSNELVTEAAALFERLRNPVKVLERYPQPRKVVTVKPETALSTVLRFISKNDFSQFPLYVDGHVVGLLTEKTITRWLSKYSSGKQAVSFKCVTIAMVVAAEVSSTTNFKLVSHKERADTVAQLFIEHIDLEAVVVVRSMSSPQGLCGIITTWDIMNAGSVQ